MYATSMFHPHKRTCASYKPYRPQCLQRPLVLPRPPPTAVNTGHDMPLEDLTKRANYSKYDESVVKDMPEYPGLSLSSHVILKMVQVRACGLAGHNYYCEAKGISATYRARAPLFSSIGH